MNPREDFCGILLAAGRSTRFPPNKLLHRLPGGTPGASGTPIAVASGRAMRAVLPWMIAVVRSGDTALRMLFEREGIPTVVANGANEGIGNSLACGVATAKNARGWIVALADMPFILPETHALVVDALAAGAALAAPVYRGQRGHPVGFSSRFFEALTSLRGDEGAREILRSAASVELIDCGDPGVVWDIDSPDHLLPSKPD